ncbi:endolytic transglycosylase MltG [Bacillus tianshenii]|nr:endolytic transglycosylase MltG [Bacillus tianshenii]
MSSTNSDDNQHKPDRFEERHDEAKTVRKIVLAIVLTVGLLVVSGAVGGYFYISSALKPVNLESEKMIDVTIPIGSSTRSIANILEENGVIKDDKMFRYYIKFKNETGFQAGDYVFSPSMKIDDIIAQLKTGKVMKQAELKVTIPEGKQLTEIAGILAKKTDHTKEEIMEKLDDRQYVKQLMKKYPSLLTDEILAGNVKHPLEGYLFPATYHFYEKKPSLEKIIEKMLGKTEAVLKAYEKDVSTKQYSVHEVMTMASLIEEEATEEVDREKISSVFYNRTEEGMPLQTDPTVLYSLGKHQVQITYDDLEVDSPYNTYQNAGLPPGPIASPGETSIQAALNPSETKYLYFYARPSGEVIFTKTLQEHNEVKHKYKHEWDQYKEKN